MPRTKFSSKLAKQNFVNIWNEIDENRNHSVQKLYSNSCYVSVIQLCSSAMFIALTPVVWSASAKTSDGSDHKQWNN